MSDSTDEIFQRLKKENEELRFELKDLNYLIQMKEEELESLHAAAHQMAELQSKLVTNLYQIEQMQLHVSEAQQQTAGAIKRENVLEDELTHNVSIEKSYYDIKEKYTSTKTALDDLYREMNEVSKLYKEVAELKRRVSELESNLEIATLDNQFLKEELEQFRKKIPKTNHDSE